MCNQSRARVIDSFRLQAKPSLQHESSSRTAEQIKRVLGQNTIGSHIGETIKSDRHYKLQVPLHFPNISRSDTEGRSHIIPRI